MKELGFPIEVALPWFPNVQEATYVRVSVSEEHANSWPAALADAFRRCYVTDVQLDARVAEANVTKAQIVAAKLPDPGSVMAGDFGEILVAFYQATQALPHPALGVMKWRLKQDRTKAAPRSDVIHFVLPSWPTATAADELLCAEVKMKATDTANTPIKNAIEDSAKDRTSRLGKTLAWLKERAIAENLGDVTIAHIDRFSETTKHPPYKKAFRAVAVICSSLVDRELGDVPATLPTDYAVVVMSVPNLRALYMRAFQAVHDSVAEVAE